MEGVHLVIDHGDIALVGAGPRSSRLRFRAFGGGRHDEHWQLVNGKVWRGDGIVVRGGGGATHRIDRVRIAGLTLDGGARRSESMIWPAGPSDGRGWDLTHKGIRIEEDLFVGEIVIEDCDIGFWRGELIYQGGRNGERLVVRNCRLHDSDGDGLSSSMGNTVYDCNIFNISFAGIECGYLDKASIYHRLRIFNVDHEGISLVNQALPGASAGRQSLRDIVVRNCRTGLIGKSLTNAVVRNVDFIDCGWTGGGTRAIQLYDSATSPCADVSISDVRITVDDRDLDTAVAMIRTGPMDWRNVRLTGLRLGRTAAGRAADRTIGRLVDTGANGGGSVAKVQWDSVAQGAVRHRS